MWSQAELDALRKAYASGTLRVSYDGRSVEYGSEADLLRRIRTIEAEMAAAEGRPKPRRSLARVPQGLRTSLRHELARPDDRLDRAGDRAAPRPAAGGDRHARPQLRGGARRPAHGRLVVAGTSANAEIGTALARLRDRSRDLVRNNPYAAKAQPPIRWSTRPRPLSSRSASRLRRRPTCRRRSRC